MSRDMACAMACSTLWLAPADIVLTCYDTAATTSGFTTWCASLALPMHERELVRQLQSHAASTLHVQQARSTEQHGCPEQIFTLLECCVVPLLQSNQII